MIYNILIAGNVVLGLFLNEKQRCGMLLFLLKTGWNENQNVMIKLLQLTLFHFI